MEGNKTCKFMMILVISVLFCQCSKKFDDIKIAIDAKEKKKDFISILNINCFPSKEIPLPYLLFIISNKVICHKDTSNEDYYLVFRGKKMKLEHVSNDCCKMYLTRNLESLYSNIVLKKKNKVGEVILFVYEKDLKNFFTDFSREAYILSDNNCKILFSRSSKITIQYNEIFWHPPRP